MSALAAVLAALSLADLSAQLDVARGGAQRWGRSAIFYELRVETEGGGERPVFSFVDLDRDDDADLFLDVTVKDGKPTVRLQREPKGQTRRPAALELSKATAAWSALKWGPGEQPSPFEGYRLRALPSGAACWRAKVKGGKVAFFDAATGEKSAACGEPWEGK